MSASLSALIRGKSPIRPIDALRGGGGAVLGVLLAGLTARLLMGGADWLHPLLAAPIGASAVLVFAVPASPLAQPRAVIGGNLVSALVGITVALLVPQPLLAAPLAVGLAIGTMMLLGCLHPPGGAVALICVIGGPAVAKAGYLFAVSPIALDSALLVGVGMAWGRLTGHSYPHRAPAPAKPVGYSALDLDQALARYGELLDVDREDLDALFREVERSAARRLHAQIRCGAVMSRDLTLVRRNPSAPEIDENAPIAALLPILSSGQAHAAVVVDAARRPVGVITQTDLLGVLYRAHIVESAAA